MNFSNVLGKLTDRIRQKQVSRADQFIAVVRKIADGQEPNADEVERILADNGKSVDDLTAAVERLTKRRELHAQIKRAEQAKEEKNKLTVKLAAAAEKLNAAQAEYDKVYAPIRERMFALEQEINTKNFAEQQLMKDPDPVLVEQEQALGKQAMKLSQRREQIRESRTTCRWNAEHARQKRESDYAGGKEEQLERIKEAEDRAAEFDRLDSELSAQICELRRQQDEVGKQMGLPEN